MTLKSPHTADESPPGPAPGGDLELLLRIERQLAQALAGVGSAAQVAPRVVGAIGGSLGWSCGTFWTRDADAADRLVCLGAWGVEAPGIAEYLGHAHGRRPILNNAGLVGAAWLGAAPLWVGDIARDDAYRRVPTAMRAGLHSALAFPVAVGQQVLGVIELHSVDVRQPAAGLLAGLRLLSGQIAQFLLRAQTQQQLADSEKRFRCLSALSSDWYWEQDAQHRFVRFEGRGVTRDAAELAPLLLGRRPWEVTGLVPGSADWDAHRTLLQRHEPLRDFEFVCRTATDEFVHVCAQGDPQHDADGRFTGYRGMARDLSAHRQAMQRIQYLATHDDLTGLPNRASLRQLVGQAVELARRYQRCFAVLLLDIDRFQRLNDSLGREAGDALLRALATRLKQQLRASDVVARLEGDQFAVLGHELRTPDDAEPVARRLLQAVNEPLVVQGRQFRLTACIGVVTYPLSARDEPSLMQQAERALRAAKHEGAGRLRFGDATGSAAERSPA